MLDIAEMLSADLQIRVEKIVSISRKQYYRSLGSVCGTVVVGAVCQRLGSFVVEEMHWDGETTRRQNQKSG